MNKKYNIVLLLLFIVYLFGYFSISKTLIPIMCVIQVFLIEHIFRVRNRIMQIGEIIIIVASIILFIDNIIYRRYIEFVTKGFSIKSNFPDTC